MPYNRPNCIKIFIWLLLCYVLFFPFILPLSFGQIRDITVNWSRLKKKMSIIIVKYSFSPICNLFGQMLIYYVQSLLFLPVYTDEK